MLGHGHQWAGPSVERSWETLRTDSTRAAVTPGRRDAGPQVDTARGQVRQFEHTKCDPQSSPAGEFDVTLHQCSSSSSSCQYQQLYDCSRPVTVDVTVLKTGLTLGFAIDARTDSPQLHYHSQPPPAALTVKKVFRGYITLHYVIDF